MGIALQKFCNWTDPLNDATHCFECLNFNDFLFHSLNLFLKKNQLDQRSQMNLNSLSQGISFHTFSCKDRCNSIQSSSPALFGSPEYQSENLKTFPDEAQTHWPSVSWSVPPVQYRAEIKTYHTCIKHFPHHNTGCSFCLANFYL